MTDLLPPGVHPHDPRGGTPMPGGSPVPQDASGMQAGRRSEPWGTKPEEALGVFQRLGAEWDSGVVALNANNSPLRVLNRQKGRSQLLLWTPSHVVIAGALVATPLGVMFGSSESSVAQPGAGTPFNVGDPPLLIDSEAGLWVALLPGQNAGYLAYLHAWSPPGGGLDL